MFPTGNRWPTKRCVGVCSAGTIHDGNEVVRPVGQVWKSGRLSLAQAIGLNVVKHVHGLVDCLHTIVVRKVGICARCRRGRPADDVVVGTGLGGNNSSGDSHSLVQNLNNLRDGHASFGVLVEEAIDDGAEVGGHLDV